MDHSKLSYILLVSIAVVNVSTASILVRLSNVHGFVAASWRLILSSLLTIATLLVFEARRKPLSVDKRDLGLMTVSGIALAFHFGLWMMSLFYLSVAVSVTIVDSYPAMIALAGRYILGEKYDIFQLFGAGMALLGVAGLSYYSSGGSSGLGKNPLIGLALAFTGMICVAVYFTIGKISRRKYSTLFYTSIVYTIASATAVLVTLSMGYSLFGYSIKTYTYLILLAVLPMLGGHSIINYVLSRLSLLAATVPVLGEPVGAAILAWIILGEKLTIGEALWMAIVLTGIGLVLLRETSTSK